MWITPMASRRSWRLSTLWLFVLAFLGGCASAPSIDTTYKARSQDSRVRFIVLHFTAEDFDSSLRTLTQGSVSSHYLVRDDPPTVYRLVDDDRRAYHAGESSWKGITWLNAASIGIEIVNRGFHDGQWQDYPPAQVDAVIALLKKLVREHGVSPDRILGHNEIAPQRKVDPGPRFPWKRLADEGLVLWPDPGTVAARQPQYDRQLPDIAWFQQRLEQHGYAVPRTGMLDAATRNVIVAFQMRYRPSRFDGEPDAETAAVLDALTLNHPFSKLDAELEAIAADPRAPLASLSVIAIRNGNIAYQRQWGHRFIDARNPANSKAANAATLYRVASISKLVTTLGVLRLVEEGRLSLDADIGTYLGYRLRNPHFPEAPITARMLLTHTSSLRDDAFYFWPAKHALRDVLLPGGALHGAGKMWARSQQPGAYFTYANLNWGVLGTIMERVTGERFDRLMTRLVLQPLGIRGGFNPAEFPPAELQDVAALYCKCTERDKEERWHPEGPWLAQVDDYSGDRPANRADATYVPGTNGTVFGPQGNLRISAADLAKVMKMLMNQGQHEGKRFLHPDSVDLMLSPQWRHDAAARNGETDYGKRARRFNEWGLGAQRFLDISGPASGDRLVRSGGFLAVGHLGDAYGFSGVFAFDRQRKNGLIVLIGGTGVDPETQPGAYSSLARFEERILSAIYEHAVLGP